MAWTLDPVHSSVEFAVKHMVISSVKGRFGKFDVAADFNEQNPERSSVAATIYANSIETKEEQRDGHLRSADFLHAEDFPTLTFRSTKVERAGSDGRYKVLGDLTIRGTTRQVTLDTTFGGLVRDPWGSERAGFSAETAINRKDFGLTWNAALETGGLLVGENVKISLELEFVKQN